MLYKAFNHLRPGVHMHGRYIFSYITTVVIHSIILLTWGNEKKKSVGQYRRLIQNKALVFYLFDNFKVLLNIFLKEMSCSLDHLWHWRFVFAGGMKILSAAESLLY